jgi:hypothetical protein
MIASKVDGASKRVGDELFKKVHSIFPHKSCYNYKARWSRCCLQQSGMSLLTIMCFTSGSVEKPVQGKL